jgi:hypothetical protein
MLQKREGNMSGVKQAQILELRAGIRRECATIDTLLGGIESPRAESPLGTPEIQLDRFARIIHTGIACHLRAHPDHALDIANVLLDEFRAILTPLLEEAERGLLQNLSNALATQGIKPDAI